MNALWIILAVLGGLILLLLLLLLFGKAKIRIVSRNRTKVTLSVLGIRFCLYSNQTEREAKLTDCKNPERILKKERERTRKWLAKLRKKRAKAAKVAAEKQAQTAAGENLNLLDYVKLITSMIRQIHEITDGKVRIRIKRMDLSVGTDDAAKTAILYGAVLQSTVYLRQLISDHLIRLENDPGDVVVRADYLSGKSSIDADLICYTRLGAGLIAALRIYRAYNRKSALLRRKKREKAARKSGLAD